MNEEQQWGDIHIWSPEELREGALSLKRSIKFARYFTEYSHERQSDEMPMGTRRLEMCSMEEARGGWTTRERPHYEVDAYLARVRGVEYHPSDMPTRDAWGEVWFELVPEIHHKMDPFAVAVDYEGKRIGYLKASIADRLQWIVRAKNADGYRCFLPGFIEHYGSAWISVPTMQTLESRFNLDAYYRIIRHLWDLLPQEILEREVRMPVDHPSEETAEELWRFRDTAPQFFPTESDVSQFSIVWHQVFQEVRRDYWNAEQAKKAKERSEENQRIASLYASGLTQAAIAKELGVSTHRVRTGLVGLDVKIETDRAWNNPKTQERDKRIIALYEWGMSQLRVSKEVEVSESTVGRVLKKNNVPARKPQQSTVSGDERQTADPTSSRHFEQYFAKAIQAVRQKETGVSNDSLAESFGVSIEKIEEMLADGTFYQDPAQDIERLALARQAAAEHWSKSEAKEMGRAFVRAVADRKILRHFHPRTLQG